MPSTAKDPAAPSTSWQTAPTGIRRGADRAGSAGSWSGLILPPTALAAEPGSLTATAALLEGVTHALSLEAGDLREHGHGWAAERLVYLIADVLDCEDAMRDG